MSLWTFINKIITSYLHVTVEPLWQNNFGEICLTHHFQHTLISLITQIVSHYNDKYSGWLFVVGTAIFLCCVCFLLSKKVLYLSSIIWKQVYAWWSLFKWFLQTFLVMKFLFYLFEVFARSSFLSKNKQEFLLYCLDHTGFNRKVWGKSSKYCSLFYEKHQTMVDDDHESSTFLGKRNLENLQILSSSRSNKSKYLK